MVESPTSVGLQGEKMKCNRDCFHCKYDDCIMDNVTKTERAMQNYRDNSLIVTGVLPKGHRGKNQGRKGGRYD